MNNENDLENKVKQLLRRVDQAVQRESERPNSDVDSSEGSANQLILNLVPESLFGIGMGFVMFFTAMLAILVNDTAYRNMFLAFSAICLITSAYTLDKVSSQFRRQRGCNTPDSLEQ